MPASATPFSIRAATPEDLPALLALEQSTPLAAHWSAAHYASRLQSSRGAACFLLAEGQNRICGFICARIAAREWEIENVVVAEDFRRRGIGARLMNSLIEQWKQNGGAALLLEVRASNAAARAFYHHHGFRQLAQRRAYYRDPTEDAVLYALRPGE